MAYITGMRRNKSEYTPEFVVSVDEETCIGCAR
ncbi:ferredoxin, partial [bacterium]|nr:ferredoxin [bacterium]